MKIYVVGFGSGDYESMTVDAEKAIRNSDLVVGYTVYVDLLKKIFPQKQYFSTAMQKETDRVKYALDKASEGMTVSVVCSGDSGVYGMAALVFEMSVLYNNIEIEVVPGVTAALSGGAILGAPLTHDFAVISLSDLLTPWEKIEKRLEGASNADFVICLYNPSSKKRADYLEKACNIMLKYKSDKTVCGYVKQIGRYGEESRTLTLAELKNTEVDMFTTVFVGNSETRLINGKMVTPRGYKNV